MTVAVSTKPKTGRARKPAATGPSPAAVPTSPAQLPEYASSDVFERVPMSYDDYLNHFGEDGIVEWANGEALIHMPPSTSHQYLSGYLGALLRQYVEFRQLGAILVAPFEMKLGEGKSSREPDIVFIAREHLDRLTGQRLVGPADLAVEVISPSTAAHDRATKFEEYQEIGIREYWLIDPRPGKERADFWVLDADGRFRPIPLDAQGIYRSTVVPGFWLNAAWLRGSAQPDILFTLAEILSWPEDIVTRLRAMQDK